MIGIGIDLGGTAIKSALVDSEKGIIKQFSIPTEADKGREHLLNRLVEVVRYASSKSNEQPVGVGIGAPGVISLDRKTVSNPPNLPGWEKVPLAAFIENETGLHCRIENDANLAALGSARFGVGIRFKNFIMVTLGTGVGGGIILDGQIFRGANGGAGELGHVTINYEGAECNSPTIGGIEAYMGQRFLSAQAAKVIQSNPENPLNEQFKGKWDELQPYDLYLACKSGNLLAEKILNDAGKKLGYAIVNYVHILDIRKIVVSGGVSRAGDYLLKPAQEAALERLMNPFKEGFEILFEPQGNDIALLGAGSLAIESK